MLNTITIQGGLTADPELHTTAGGVSVCSFTIACERDYQPDKNNKISDFITVVAWRGTAEFVCNYFQKGRMIIVTGDLEQRKYQDKDGNNRSVYEVQAKSVYFSDSKRNDDSSAPVGAAPVMDEVDEALPF